MMTLAVLTVLTACDESGRRNYESERGSRTYQAAMADYSAGRLDKAIAGFEKVLRDDPANTSARFQLACLQQDKLHDYLAALCNYREYMMQTPSSEKAGVAQERARICERELANAFAKKMNAVDGAAAAAENVQLKAAVKTLTDENAALKAAAEELRKDLAVSRRENENLRRLVSSIGNDDALAKVSLLPSDRDLLDDDESEDFDRSRFSADVKNLLNDERAETTETPFKVEEKKPAAKPAVEPLHEKRPETYVVQDGDTLYKLAVRFYGVRSAWTKIRDANKTEISTDGRVKAGQTIRLP